MIQTFQFRLLPNKGQAAALTRILEDNCETYNAALQERRDAWKLQRKLTHEQLDPIIGEVLS